GDIAEIGPRNPPARVQAALDASGLDGNRRLAATGGDTVATLLARSRIPDDPRELAGLDPDALAIRLQPLPHREYSIASIHGEGGVRLLVREMALPDGSPGLGSGWLCRHAQPGATIDLRLRAN